MNNYVPKHTWHHADSEYVSGVDIDRKGTEFTGDTFTYKHSKYGLLEVRWTSFVVECYGIVEFNIPLDTVQVILETGGPEHWCASPIQ